MRRLTATIALLLCFAALSWGSSKQPVNLDRITKQVSAFSTRTPQAKLLTSADLGQAGISHHKQPPVRRTPIASTEAIEGDYVMTFEGLGTLDGGGKSVTVKAIGNDSVQITNFWTDGIVVKAAVNRQAGTLSIANCVVGRSSQYGDIDLAVCDAQAKPKRSTPLVGTLADDGSITFSQPWGIFVASGDKKDNFYAAYSGALMERPNATMGCTFYGGKIASYGVVVTQVAANLLRVKNFANYGSTIEVLLFSDSTATIETQVAHADAARGNWWLYSITYNDSTGALQGLIKDVQVSKATDKRTLRWGPWSLFTQSETEHIYEGVITEGHITTNFDLQYPHLSVSEFEGAGTEADPYKIKTLDDMLLLSEKVNRWPDAISDSRGNKLYQAYKGKHFKMTADINMGEYRFTPIGRNTRYRFAGTFDGDGHTLSNVNVKAAGYAAIFGRADTTSAIKNVTVKGAKVASTGPYAAGLVAYTDGTITNCHAEGVTLTSTDIGSGGLAGISGIITKSTVNNSSITALGGYAGGLAGECDYLVEDCSATGVTVMARSYNSDGADPIGGLVGSVNGAKVTRCYFSGLVDGLTGATKVYLGGLIGSTAGATLDRCFAVGIASAYNMEARIGGLVGDFHGVMTNCYSAGRVQNYMSQYTGGLTGMTGIYFKDGVSGAFNPSITNCYTATTVGAYTYGYNPDGKVRELIGNGNTARLTLTNTYFDRQMTNFTSPTCGANTAQLTSASGPEGFGSDVWTFSEGYYPRLKGLDANQAALLSATALVLPATSSYQKVATNGKVSKMSGVTVQLANKGALTSQGHYCSLTADSLVIKDDFGADTLFITGADGTQIFHFIKIAPVPFEGDGSEVNPYLIKAKKDIDDLAAIVNEKGQFFPETHFRMTNDIDMERDPAFTPIAAYDTKHLSLKFAGIFDGDGHAIHNLSINAVAWKTEPASPTDGTGVVNTSASRSFMGLFGSLALGGTVKNLTMARDCDFYFYGSSAPFVGYNYGNVENCRNLADVTGANRNIGGIVGYNFSHATIKGCYNEGTVLGGSGYVGGITGCNFGDVASSMNVGNVTMRGITKLMADGNKQMRSIGGIAGVSGTSATYTDVVNGGTITATGSEVGGIAGNTGAMAKYTHAVNYGMLVSVDKVQYGTITGTESKAWVPQECYYDAQITNVRASALKNHDQITAAATSLLTSGKPLAGLDTAVWQFQAGRYPIIRAFAGEEGAKQVPAMVMTLPQGINASNATQNAQLATVDGLTWILSSGKGFSISGSTLVSPAPVTENVADTLTAHFGRFSKAIPIQCVIPIPLTGNGTEADPYLLTDSTDWRNLAAYVLASHDGLAGKFIKVTNDISFKAVDPMMALGSDGLTEFCGTLDGYGHKFTDINFSTGSAVHGLIESIGEQGAVNNLTLEGTMQASGTYAGGLAGNLKGTLQNCVNAMTVSSTQGTLGGLVGNAYGTARLTDCINKGQVTGAGSYVAGIAGESKKGAVYVRCANVANIVGQAPASNRPTVYGVAGIVGRSYPGTFDHCYNTGKIMSSDITSSKRYNLAGIVGMAQQETSRDTAAFIFQACYNTGEISGYKYLGGINAGGGAPMLLDSCYNTGDIVVGTTSGIAYSAGLSAYYAPGSSYTDCWNSGNVSGGGGNYMAGIAAYATSSSASQPVSFLRCVNYGLIFTDGTNAAGILSRTGNYVTVQHCVNAGSVEAGSYVGGITSNFYGDHSLIDHCANYGDLTAKTYQMGGLVAYSASLGLVSNSLNVGTVTSLSSKTGTMSSNGYNIGGLGGNVSCHFSGCYNTGAVKGATQVAGLLANTSKDKTQLVNCYNVGRLESVDPCGSVLGIDWSNTRYTWGEKNRLDSVYYLTDYGTYALDSVGTALPAAKLVQVDMGPQFVSLGDYCYPVVATYADSAWARVAAAAVVVAEGDTYAQVTQPVHVGVPQGVVWTCDNPAITFSGNDVVATSQVKGEITLTATCQGHSKSVTLNVDLQSGISDVAYGAQIVRTEYYSLSGMALGTKKPTTPGIYIATEVYASGTTKARKLVVK